MKPLLLAFGLSVGLLSCAGTQPNTQKDQDHAEVREILHQIQRETNPEKKYALGSQLLKSSALETFPPEIQKQYTAEDRKIWQDLDRWRDEIFARATKFEASLSPQDVALITAENPNSVFRHLGRFFSLPPRNRYGECTRGRYEALAKKVGLHELDERGPAVMVLSSDYDGLYQISYVAKIRSLLKTEARWAAYRDLEGTYYAELARLLDLTEGKAEETQRKRVEKQEGALVESGIPKSRVPVYVAEMAQRSPQCLGGINFDFLRWVREDVTRTRGAFLFGEIKKYVSTHGKAPASVDELSLSSPDPLLREKRDGWYQDFVLEPKANGIKLYSVGGDGEPGTKDDWVAGTVKLPARK